MRAKFSFDSKDDSSLSFKKGDVLLVLSALPSGWLDGLNQGGERGWYVYHEWGRCRYSHVAHRALLEPQNTIRKSSKHRLYHLALMHYLLLGSPQIM